MPPQHVALAVADRTTHPICSGRVDGPADIVIHLNKMSIKEEDRVTEGSDEDSSTNRHGSAATENEDLAAITNAVKGIRLTNPAAETVLEEASTDGKVVVGDGEEREDAAKDKDNVVISSAEEDEAVADDEVVIVDAKSCSKDDSPDSGTDSDVSYARQSESSEYDDSSSSDEEEDETEVINKRRNLISRGPERNRTRVYSSDRHTGGCVYTYNRASTRNVDISVDLQGQQSWSNYREPQTYNELSSLYNELSNLDCSTNQSDLLQSDLDPLSLLPEATINFNILPDNVVHEFFQQLDNEGAAIPHKDTDDEGVGELFPSSPESVGINCFPSHSYPYSVSSGVMSTSTSMLSPSSSSQPPSPAGVYVPSESPRHMPVLRPKARPAREAILDCLSQDEKDEACLMINNASEEKLMRVNDPDGDTDLTVLVQFWENHNRPMALLYAMVARMKFIKNGLSKKTRKGDNALHLAALHAHADPLVAKYIAEVMVEYGEDVNEVDRDGNTVIHRVCCRGDSHVHVLEELLCIKKFDVNHANSYGETPLGLALRKGARQMVTLLHKHGAQLDQQRNDASFQVELPVLLHPQQLQVQQLYTQ